MNKCESCLMLREARLLKTPIIGFLESVNGKPVYCRKCYQDERTENERFRETLLHIAENGCAKCGNVAEHALQDIDPNYEAMMADLTPEYPK